MELTATQAPLASSPGGRDRRTPAPSGASPAPRGQSTAGGAPTTSTPPVDRTELARAVEQMTKAVESLSAGRRRVRFHLDRETGTVVARILDGESERVVRQIPGEGFLDVAARLRDLGSLLMDEVG